MITKNPNQLFERWRRFLANDESLPTNTDKAEALRDLVRDIREAGRSVDKGDTRDRLALLAQTVARAVATLSDGIEEPANQLEPFETKSPFRLHTDGMPPSSRLFIGRENSIRELDTALAAPNCRVVQIVGFGGQGKTQLVNYWIEQLQKKQENISSIFCYSFYTFPSHTFKRVPTFIEEARNFFLEPLGEGLKSSPRERWADDVAWLAGVGSGKLPIAPPSRFDEKILTKMKQQPPRILILDGLEAVLRLKEGKWVFRKGATAIKDLLETFLKLNSGLCLITTRFQLGILENQKHSRSVTTIELDGLTNGEGADLLSNFLDNGYTKTQLKKVSWAFHGHPISILAFGDILADQASSNSHLHNRISLEALINEALKDTYNKLAEDDFYRIGTESEDDLDIKDPDLDFTRHPIQDQVDTIAFEASDAESEIDERARGVIRSYLRYFAEQGSEKGKATFQLVRLISFFQEATSVAALQVLIRLQDGVSAGFNDQLRNVLIIDREPDQKKLVNLLEDLKRRQLIQERSEDTGEIPAQYDTHPLLREFLRTQLAQNQPDAWRAGHRALANYYATTVSEHNPKTYPTEKKDLLAHYKAVEHACQAQEWQLAYDFYWFKIHHNSEQPGEDNYQWFAWEKYGLQSTDIRALAFFYNEIKNQSYWQTLDPDFKTKAKNTLQAHIRIATSLCLLNLGFLKEAGEPLNSCYTSAVKSRDNLTAAILGGLLGDRYLIQGELEDARRWLKKALYHAEKKQENHGQIRSKWAKLGNLYAYTAEWGEARLAFDKVKKQHHTIVTKVNSSLPAYPYTRSGYYYSDYLLTIAELILINTDISALDYPKLTTTKSAHRWAFAKLREVRDETRSILDNHGFVLNKHEKSFNYVAHGWALGALAIYKPAESSFGEAIKALEKARSIQDDVEQRQDLPRTLVLLARFLGLEKQLDEALDTVNQALSIAWATGMRLYECDAYLVRCQISLAQETSTRAMLLHYYRTAQRLIDDIGYRKRLPDLKKLRDDLIQSRDDISDNDLPSLIY